MKIEKIYQPMPMTGGNILDAKSNSSVDTYSCNYINQLIDIFYPIGSIYMSAKITSPADLFGGEWVRLEGRFIYASAGTSGDGGKDDISTITGTATEGIALSVNQIPSHSHKTGISGTNAFTASVSSGGNTAQVLFDQNTGVYTTSTGGGQAHSHQVPFISVYTWQRIG